MATLEFNQVLLSNAEFLKPFAITLTRDNEAAKDLFQETIYRALVNKDKYKVGTNVKAWLYTIMRNVFINGYRRKAKQQTIFDATPNEALINANQTTVINDATANLNVKLYFDGFKYNEIAEALNEPLGTIKSRIHFARKLLKEHVERF